MPLKDMKVEEVYPTQQYLWVESVRPKKLHWLRVKLEQVAMVFAAINPHGKVVDGP